MLTLVEMQKSSKADLEKLALETDCRQYSLALTQIVCAMDAYAVGDMLMVRAHVERAKVAYIRAQEDMHGQVKRAERTMAVVAEKGLTAQGVETVGKNVVKTRMGGKLVSWQENWSRW